jgi:hypothetical protein
MKIEDITKLVVAIAIIAGAIFLAWSKVVGGDAAIGVLGAIAGYILGNSTRVLADKITNK